MKYSLLFYFFVSLACIAQLPQPGIYRLAGIETYQNPYEYNYAQKKWTSPQHWSVVEQYKIRYAMVAVDSNLKVKIVLIPKINPGDTNVPLHLLNGFANQTDSLATLFYSLLEGDDAGFEQRQVRYWPTAFRIAENQIIKKDTQQVNRKPKPFFTIRPTGSRFQLAQSRPYSSLFCISPAQVASYSKPDASKNIQRYLKQGDCVAIVTDTGQWLQAEWISPEGKISQGWLLKVDLQVHAWITQKRQTPTYRFELGWTDTTSSQSHSSYEQGPIALAIKIIPLRQKNPIQVIERPQAESSYYSSLEDALQVYDCNFDGYPDLEIFAHTGGAGPNFGNDYYLYNPDKQIFEYNEELSSLTQPEIDTVHRLIYSAWRNGAGNHGSEVYTFTNGKLDTLQRWERNCISTGLFCNWYEGKRVAGKWIETEKRSAFLGSAETGKAVRIPVFAHSDDKQTIDTITNSEVVVQEENARWLLVEYDGVPTNQGPTIKKGWIQKEIFVDSWKPIQTQTRHFRVEIPATETNSGWNAIRIINRKSNQAHQIILLDTPLLPNDSLIHIGDYNFDNQPDFRIESDMSVAVLIQQQRFDYYTFNSQTGYFERDNFLSSSPNVMFIKKGKSITTEWFTQEADNYLYHKKAYSFIKKQWQLIESWEGNCQLEFCEITHRKFQKEQWVEKIERVPLETLLPKNNETH